MKFIDARVIDNVSVAEEYYEMSFSWPSEETPLPGQFLTIRASDRTTPLLRRPFAFSRFDDGVARIIYQKRGDATAILAAKTRDEPLNVVGPLGNIFPVPRDSGRPVLVAGGVGIGPIFFFAEHIRAHNPLLVVGARTRGLLPAESCPHGIETVYATDDGSFGFHGTVVDVLKTTYSTDDNWILYLCGPEPMLKAGHEFATERRVPAWVSLEQTMGCAVGACMGCAVRVTGGLGYARVCTEGPVFDSREIVWT